MNHRSGGYSTGEVVNTCRSRHLLWQLGAAHPQTIELSIELARQGCPAECPRSPRRYWCRYWRISVEVRWRAA